MALAISLIKQGKAMVLKEMLDYGLDPNDMEKTSPSLLEHALKAKNVKIFNILLNAGADAKKKDFDGGNILLKSVLAKQSEFVKILVDHGVNIELADNGGNTALHQASRLGLQTSTLGGKVHRNLGCPVGPLRSGEGGCRAVRHP